MSYTFLSTEWFDKVDELIAAAGDLQIPAEMKAVEINVTVTTPRGDAKLYIKDGVLAGHLGTINPVAVELAVASLAVVVLWPKSYTMPTAPVGLVAKTRRLSAHVPGTVVALAGATIAVTLLELPVVTSARRYRAGGPLRTMLHHWRIAAGWALGVDRERLARWARR